MLPGHANTANTVINTEKQFTPEDDIKHKKHNIKTLALKHQDDRDRQGDMF